MTENEINKKMAAEFYRDIELPKPNVQDTDLQQKIDELDGVKPGFTDYIHTILEMHVDLNLDDYENFDNRTKKAIKIPYIVTIEKAHLKYYLSIETTNLMMLITQELKTLFIINFYLV